jgi:putative ABC transport system permease protein
MRRQPLRVLIALASVAAGVSLVAAIPIVSHSTKVSFIRFAHTLAGPAPLRVIGPVSRAGLDQSVVPRVAATPGVAAVVPVVQAVTLVSGPHGDEPVVALGFDCRIEALGTRFGCNQAALDAAPLTSPPFVSHHLQRTGGLLRTDVGTVPLQGSFALAALDRLNGGRAVAMPLHVAQHRFARPGALDVLYVLPAAGVSPADLQARLAPVVGGWNRVLTSTDLPPGASLAGSLLLPLLGLMGLFALGIGAVLIRNTIALSLAERRHDLAVATALGAAPRVVFAGVLMESGLLGVVGGVLGALGGIGVAHPLTAALSSFTEKLAGIHLSVVAGSGPFVFSAGLGFAMAVVAAWAPARQATRFDVVAELSQRELRDEIAPSVSARRATIYGLVGGLAIVVIWFAQRHGGVEPWAPATAQVALVVAMLFLVMCVGSIAPVVVHAVKPRRSAPAGLRLAWANLVREPGRTRVMAVATASAVGIAFSLASVNESISKAVTKEIVSATNAAVSVSTVDPNNTINVDAKPSPEVIAGIGRVPGVASVNRAVASLVGTHDNDLIGVGADDSPRLTLTMIRGTKDPARFARGEVLVGPALARRKHLHPGSTLRLPGRTGFLDVTVQGIWQDGDFNGTRVTMPIDLYERAWGAQPAGFLRVNPEPGTGLEVLAARIRASGLDPFLHAYAPRALARIVAGDIRAQLRPFWAMQRGLLLVSFITVLFTLLLVAVQRRRELGLLGAVGMRPAELARMVTLEAVMIGTVGAALGTVASLGFSEAFRQAATILVGFRDPFTVAIAAPLVWAPVAVAVVAAAAGWPAWRAARVDVIAALRYE